eukprot:403340984
MRNNNNSSNRNYQGVDSNYGNNSNLNRNGVMQSTGQNTKSNGTPDQFSVINTSLNQGADGSQLGMMSNKNANQRKTNPIQPFIRNIEDHNSKNQEIFKGSQQSNGYSKSNKNKIHPATFSKSPNEEKYWTFSQQAQNAQNQQKKQENHRHEYKEGDEEDEDDYYEEEDDDEEDDGSTQVNSALQRKGTSIFSKDASHGLSYEKMVYSVDKTHPRITIKDQTTLKTRYEKHPFCKTKTGWNCCCRSQRHTDFAQYGSGIALYFQFLKHITLVLFIMSVLSIPSYIFYYSGNTAEDGKSTSVKYVLAALSLGNIGQSDFACNSAQMAQGKISLYCAYGTLDTVSMFGQSLSNSTSSCKNDGETISYTPTHCDYENSKFGSVNKKNIDTAFNESCSGKVSCDFPLNTTLVPTNCTTGANPVVASSQVIYFLQAVCKSDKIDVFLSGKLYLEKSKVALVVVILDLIIAFFFWISFVYLRAFQNITLHEINESVITASDFTVQIKHLPGHDNLKQLKTKMWWYLENVLEQENIIGQSKTEYTNPQTGVLDENQNNIMDIQFGLNDYGRLEYMMTMATQLQSKKKYEALIKDDPSKRDIYQEKIDELNKLAIQKLKDMEDYAKKNKQQAVIVYAQFQSMNGKEKYIRSMKRIGLCRRICGNKQAFRHKYLDESWPEVKYAPEPSVILWKNLKVGGFERISRTLFVTLITLILLAFSVMGIVVAKYYQDKYSSKYNLNNCGSIDVTQTQAYNDYVLPEDRQTGLLGCYCYSQFKIMQFKIADIVFQNQQKLCYDWLTGYTITNAMIYSTAVLITILNVVITEVLIRLSRFQKFHTKTEEKASSTIKMFLIQFINTGLVILLVNAKVTEVTLPDFFPLLGGEFQDFTVEWYRVVGTTICLTMMINVIAPHIGAFIKIFIKSFKRCVDRGCTCNKRKTKKLLQDEYNEVYSGPEFLIEVRYAQVMTSIFITMIYSSGMPILYLVAMTQFFMMYWVDKFLFIKVYKNPPRYGIELSDISRKVLMYSVLVHLCFGFYIYSNSSIFTYDDDLPYLSFILGSMLIFIIFTLTELIQSCFQDSWKKCCCLCFNQKNHEDMVMSSFSSNIYKELGVEDLKQEYKKTKTELADIKNMLQSGSLPSNERTNLIVNQLTEKVKTIKGILLTSLKSEGMMGANDTMDGFLKLFKHKKNDTNHRLKTTYSYDIKDDPTYKRVQKIEKRMRKYYEKQAMQKA